MVPVTKKIFINSLTCPAFGWMLRNGRPGNPSPKSPGEAFRRKMGEEIAAIARLVYRDGVNADSADWNVSVEKTRNLMAAGGPPVIFEAAFEAGEFRARADILRRDAPDASSGSARWHLIKVKSGIVEKGKYIDDLAFTHMVMSMCGHDVAKSALFLVSRDYRLKMRPRKLFNRVLCTREVAARSAEFAGLAPEIARATSAAARPVAGLKNACRACDIFGECVGEGIKNHIFDIPMLGREIFDELFEAGIIRVEDVPDGFRESRDTRREGPRPLPERARRMIECVKKKRIYVGEGLEKGLERIVWPACYLDFETVMAALPLYDGTAPYDQIPTQYSLHKCSAPGVIESHVDFIADPSRDCSRQFAEKLLADLGCPSRGRRERGSIVVYSGFEKVVIERLAEKYRDLSRRLRSLVSRLFDMEALIRNHFYHPDFHGGSSIKKTLPVLVPEMSYESLAIKNGDSALAAFAGLAHGAYTPEEAAAVVENLREYCKYDTLAMVMLHKKLCEICRDARDGRL